MKNKSTGIIAILLIIIIGLSLVTGGNSENKENNETPKQFQLTFGN